jgi:hypothetical protein
MSRVRHYIDLVCQFSLISTDFGRPKIPFFAPNFPPQFSNGHEKTDIAAIPLHLPVRQPHAEAMMDPGEIPDLIELIDTCQRDILGGELSFTSITKGLATLNH